jgi:two-component system, OmpR family, heavy metal sensor histidine kinase CusS
MFFAKRPKAAVGEGTPFRRLDLLYFVLAGFDLITICAALLLNHTVTTAFEEGVRTSAAWSLRQVEIIHLARLAQETDAPGNDVFFSRDVTTERARHASSMARFEAEWELLAADIASDPLFSSGADDDLLEHLLAARETMREVSRHSERVFSAYERRNVIGAAGAMAIMDRSYAEVNRSLDAAINVVDRIRTEHLEQQVVYARDMRSLELVIGGAVLVIVCLVAAYGMFIGRTMRAGEAQRLAMVKELAAGRDRLQRYADDVSHELRGPISKMRLDAEVLLRQDRSPEKYREAIEAVLGDCERVSSIVESLLFMARAENTREAINPQNLDLPKELGLIVEFYNAAAEQAGIKLVLRAEPGSLMADRSLFQRAVSNLVSNAIDHTPKGGRVTISASAGEPGVVVEVADTGPGMSEEVRAHVFDRFYRGGGGRSRNGLGLGLAITKSIMELHGGAIELRSREGFGAQVQLFFPKISAYFASLG